MNKSLLPPTHKVGKMGSDASSLNNSRVHQGGRKSIHRFAMVRGQNLLNSPQSSGRIGKSH